MGDLIVGGGGGNHRQQIGKLLNNFIGRWDQVRGMWLVGLGIENEEATCALTNPLDQPPVVRAVEQGFDAIERIGASAAGSDVRRLGPLINHRKGKAEFGGDLLGTALLENFAQDFV